MRAFDLAATWPPGSEHWTAFRGVPARVAVADRAVVCHCPCAQADHVGICQPAAIEPGEHYLIAFLYGELQVPAPICYECWDATNPRSRRRTRLRALPRPAALQLPGGRD